jgi:hypothetical protein
MKRYPFPPGLTRWLIPGLLLLTLAGCLQAAFDQRSLDRTTDLKSKTLALMDKSGEPFTQHATAVSDVRSQMRSALAAEELRKQNKETVAMWREILVNDTTSAGSPVGFFNRWQQQGTVNPVFLSQARPVIEKNFDRLIELENAKTKSLP